MALKHFRELAGVFISNQAGNIADLEISGEQQFTGPCHSGFLYALVDRHTIDVLKAFHKLSAVNAITLS